MKKIELTIKNCNECPYFSHDSDYGMSYDSGYNCDLSGERIMDDYQYDKLIDKTMSIPDTCPLENK